MMRYRLHTYIGRNLRREDLHKRLPKNGICLYVVNVPKSICFNLEIK